MENITRQTTVLNPSRLAMPAYGHLWTSVQGSISGVVVGTGVVRDRGAKTAIAAFAAAPGDSVWRPPIC